METEAVSASAVGFVCCFSVLDMLGFYRLVCVCHQTDSIAVGQLFGARNGIIRFNRRCTLRMTVVDGVYYFNFKT